jgi:hypothetical protein
VEQPVQLALPCLPVEVFEMRHWSVDLGDAASQDLAIALPQTASVARLTVPVPVPVPARASVRQSLLFYPPLVPSPTGI